MTMTLTCPRPATTTKLFNAFVIYSKKNPPTGQSDSVPPNPSDRPKSEPNFPDPLRPGSILGGRYKLLENIGEGGNGLGLGSRTAAAVKRRVAIKLVKPGMDSKQVLARFDAERQALAMMDHPNIAKVFDGGMAETGRPYFVMEYVKGVPFTKYCDTARLSLKDRMRLFIPVCQAVQPLITKGSFTAT